MYGDTFSALQWVAATLSAIAVKALDDLLDLGPDAQGGTARAVYCPLCLVMSCLFHLPTGATLFLCCYSTGMLINRNDRRKLASVLAETSAVTAIMALMLGPRRVVAGLLLAVWVQAIDDVMDASGDRSLGKQSLASRYGSVACVFLAACLACLSMLADMQIALTGAFGAVMVWLLEKAGLLGGFGERRVAG